MALKKQKEIGNTGYTADYQAIIGVNISRNESGTGVKRFYIHVGVYKDQAARESGKSPVDSFVIDIEDQQLVDSLLGTLYNKLKNLPEFDGAIDV